MLDGAAPAAARSLPFFRVVVLGRWTPTSDRRLGRSTVFDGRSAGREMRCCTPFHLLLPLLPVLSSDTGSTGEYFSGLGGYCVIIGGWIAAAAAESTRCCLSVY